MKILGITGRSGSGKGYVCAEFARIGIPTVDTDEIVHSLYRDNRACITELEQAFGPICTLAGEVDRQKLASIVFKDDSKLKTLNAIVHRYVRAEIDGKCADLERKGNRAVLLDAPQLYEAHMESLCDFVIAVIAPEELRIDRICNRDHIVKGRALERLSHQLSDDFFRSHADFVIVSDGKADVCAQVRAVADRI